MKRITAYVSGSIQKVGYRARVVQIANALGLTGLIENLEDGRARIIAEGSDDKLKWFEEAIVIKNTLIKVSSMKKTYSDASGEFSSFYKLVGQDETDSRLDQGIGVLKDILVGVKELNENLGGKMDLMLDKQDDMLDKQDDMLDKQDDMLSEIKGARTDFKSYMDQRFEKIEIEFSELKAILKAKGLI
jgi:acylphosphatase